MKTGLSVIALMVFFSLPAFSQLNTQTVVNTAGNSAASNALILEWSVGEMSLVTTTESVSNKFVLTNGFLQPNRVSKNQDLPAFGADEITVLPNPTQGHCAVKIETRQQGVVTIVVSDVNGKKILARKTVSFVGPVIERFDLTSQPQVTYIIQITLTPLAGFIGKTGSVQVVKI